MTLTNFGYDTDGNETADGRWSFGWDGENRVTWIGGATTLPAGSALGMNCAYDWRSRRISKTVSNYTAGAWSRTAVSNFVYDGWNLIAILDGLNANNLLYSFQWGTDLSGTMQGAGGVGGLISMRVHSGANAGTYFYAYDGNGNVTALVNATTGAIAAQYEYDPFGNLIRATGPMAFINPFRFSTRYQDDETGFYYYGYRYYNASTGRWLSRDPIGELGAEVMLRQRSRGRRFDVELLPEGPNIYAFIHNNAIMLVDADGRAAPPAVTVVVGLIIAAEACGLPQALAAVIKFPDSGDKFKHCWVSCRISKTCGGLIAELAGVGREIGDRAMAVYCDRYPDSIFCKKGHGDFWDSLGDLAANNQCIGWESIVGGPIGGWIGAVCRRSCEDCCKAKVGYNTGNPGFPTGNP